MITLLLEHLFGMKFEVYSLWLLVQAVCAFLVFVTLAATPEFRASPYRIHRLWQRDCCKALGQLLFWYATITIGIGSGLDLLDGHAPEMSRWFWVPMRTEGGAALLLGAVLFHWKMLYWPNLKAFYFEAIR